MAINDRLSELQQLIFKPIEIESGFVVLMILYKQTATTGRTISEHVPTVVLAGLWYTLWQKFTQTASEESRYQTGTLHHGDLKLQSTNGPEREALSNQSNAGTWRPACHAAGREALCLVRNGQPSRGKGPLSCQGTHPHQAASGHGVQPTPVPPGVGDSHHKSPT